MNNQKGVTLVALITTIILLLIIVSISASTSMSTYKNMKYETFRAELEEIQDAVNKLCEEYALAKEIDSTITYASFFGDTDRYSSAPSTVTEAISSSVSGVSDVATSYSLEDASYVYYFSQDEIKTFFNLEVTLEDGVLVDFSTRYVYSIKGCEDPDDSSTTYYTLSEMDGETNIYENTTASASSLSGVTVSPSSGTTLGTSDSTRLLKVTLTASRDSGIDYPIKKAYYSTDGGTTYIEVDYLGDCVYADNGESVSFVIYEAKSYTFKIEDTYGATATVTATYDE